MSDPVLDRGSRADMSQIKQLGRTNGPRFLLSLNFVLLDLGGCHWVGAHPHKVGQAVIYSAYIYSNGNSRTTSTDQGKSI